jgi:hypothetical protein
MKIDFQLWQCLVFIQVFRQKAYNMLFTKLLFLNTTIDSITKYHIFKCTDFVYRQQVSDNLVSLIVKMSNVCSIIGKDDIENNIEQVVDKKEELFTIYDDLAKTAVDNKLEDVAILFENNKKQFIPFLNIFSNYSLIAYTLYETLKEKIIKELKEDLEKQHPNMEIDESRLSSISLSIILSTFMNEILQDIVKIDNEDGSIKEYSHDIKLSPFKSELVDADINLVTYNTLIENIVNYLNISGELEKNEDDAVNMLNLLEDLQGISLN